MEFESVGDQDIFVTALSLPIFEPPSLLSLGFLKQANNLIFSGIKHHNGGGLKHRRGEHITVIAANQYRQRDADKDCQFSPPDQPEVIRYVNLL